MSISSRRRALLPAIATTGLLATFAVAAPVTAASGSFTNPDPIIIGAEDTNEGEYSTSGTNDTDIVFGETAGAGSVYPSTVDLTAPVGSKVNDLRVQVNLTHERMDDLDLMLVSPTGASTMLLSDGGGEMAYENGSLYFYPWGVAYPDDNTQNNWWWNSAPTDWDTTPGDTDAFPAPAPAAAQDDFEDMYGKDATGTWSLYAMDDTDGSGGTIHSWNLQTYHSHDATPTPSALAVAGLPSIVTDVNLTLNDIDTEYLGDTEFVLESPDGRRAHVMSDAGGWDEVQDLTLTLDDEAAERLSRGKTPTTGSYQPVDYDDGDTSEFVGGADTKNLSSALSTFDGINPNGNWKLYVSEEYSGSTGAISGGWSLSITSVPATPTTPATPVTVVVEAEERDTLAPKVRTVKPRKDENRIKTTASPIVRFSEAMKPASVKRAVKLVSVETGKAVDVKLTYKASKNKVTIDPKHDLDRNTTYMVVVTKAAKDLAGNRLAKTRKSRFNTL